mmetsp:Transcript_9712/g.24274  ORF Transcript_9712/g.24274 Transcript_9712/m.24274 type:complete len:313 (+) Transcript_9712:291-1229(+)
MCGALPSTCVSASAPPCAIASATSARRSAVMETALLVQRSVERSSTAPTTRARCRAMTALASLASRRWPSCVVAGTRSVLCRAAWSAPPPTPPAHACAPCRRTAAIQQESRTTATMARARHASDHAIRPLARASTHAHTRAMTRCHLAHSRKNATWKSSDFRPLRSSIGKIGAPAPTAPSQCSANARVCTRHEQWSAPANRLCAIGCAGGSCHAPTTRATCRATPWKRTPNQKRVLTWRARWRAARMERSRGRMSMRRPRRRTVSRMSVCPALVHAKSRAPANTHANCSATLAPAHPATSVSIFGASARRVH